MLFLKPAVHCAILKTDKLYDTKRELYSHEFICVTQALLNKVANVHQFYEQTKLNYEMYALKF